MKISGPKSFRKISIVLKITANLEKEGGVVTFIDTEHSVDIRYAKKLSETVLNF